MGKYTTLKRGYEKNILILEFSGVLAQTAIAVGCGNGPAEFGDEQAECPGFPTEVLMKYMEGYVRS